MKKEMEELREKIHKLLEADTIDANKVLLLSQKMDKLILRYYNAKITESFVRTKLKCEYEVGRKVHGDNGHLWVTLTGGSPVMFGILHPLSNVLIFGGNHSHRLEGYTFGVWQAGHQRHI